MNGKIDKNEEDKCVECSGGEFTIDDVRAEKVCDDCGVVVANFQFFTDKDDAQIGRAHV